MSAVAVPHGRWCHESWELHRHEATPTWRRACPTLARMRSVEDDAWFLAVRQERRIPFAPDPAVMKRLHAECPNHTVLWDHETDRDCLAVFKRSDVPGEPWSFLWPIADACNMGAPRQVTDYDIEDILDECIDTPEAEEKRRAKRNAKERREASIGRLSTEITDDAVDDLMGLHRTAYIDRASRSGNTLRARHGSNPLCEHRIRSRKCPICRTDKPLQFRMNQPSGYDRNAHEELDLDAVIREVVNGA